MRIQKNDYHRVLLTEVLPYEVPIWFSNKGLYNYWKDDKPANAPPLVRAALLLDKTKVFTPYKYKIKKSCDGIRVLSIIHPIKQLDIVNFYKKYDQMILSFCNKSPITIRNPRRVASNFFDGRLKKRVKHFYDEIEEDSDGFSHQDQFSSSYFSYSQFSFLYKFFDSYLFHNLEKRFSHICRFDIGSCFNSIYTHSIAWSAKSKDVVKETMEFHSFEAYFDKLMQSTKAKETNGIVIGPEISRIFAEIILQKIDLNIINEVERKLGLKHDLQYSIRRYIDDYFTFTNSEETSIKIREIVEEKLEEYNFALNPKKTKTLPVPFVSDISIAKTELNDVFERLNALLEVVLGASDADRVSVRASEKAVGFIHEIKSVVVKPISQLTLSRDFCWPD